MNNESIVYSELMQTLELKSEHLKDLLSRGFTQKQIENNGYKTLPRNPITSRVVEQIRKAVEAEYASLNGVAGFYRRKDTKQWAITQAILTSKSPKGKSSKENPAIPYQAIAIPVRGIRGDLQAIKLRLNHNDPRRKYMYLSSRGLLNGTSAKPLMHYPIFSGNQNLKTIRVTEGELKADYLTENTQYYTISIAGVSMWREAVKAMKHFPKVKKVILCPDADKSADVDPYSGRKSRINQVARSFACLAFELRNHGYEVVMEDWDESLGKGLDDVLVGGGDCRFLREAELDRFIEENGKPAFPHQFEMKSGAIKLLPSKENLEALLEFLGINFRYNLMKHQKELFGKNINQYYPKDINNTVNAVKSKCVLYSLPNANVPELVDLIASDNEYHPARNWIESKPWDGTERIKSLCNTLHVPQNWEFNRNLYVTKWLISTIAALYAPNYWTKLCLVLAGPGSIGKTAWFESLFGEIASEVFKDGVILDPSNKDSRWLIISNWCVELGELGATFRKRDREELKAFITERKDSFRKPYAREPIDFKRQCVFVASVDQEYFLSDEAGDVRFACIPIKGLDVNHGIDMQQLFVEVKQNLFEAGENWWLDFEQTQELIKHNSAFREIDPLEEILFTAYGEATEADKDVRSKRTAGQIYDELYLMEYVVKPNCLKTIRLLTKHLSKHYSKAEKSLSSKSATQFYMPRVRSKEDYLDIIKTEKNIADFQEAKQLKETDKLVFGNEYNG